MLLAAGVDTLFPRLISLFFRRLFCVHLASSLSSSPLGMGLRPCRDMTAGLTPESSKPSPNCDLQLGEGRRCAELVEAVGCHCEERILSGAKRSRRTRRSNLLALDYLVVAQAAPPQAHILTGRLLQLERFAFRPRNDMMISAGIPSTNGFMNSRRSCVIFVHTCTALRSLQCSCS
jgi:hypothetical protein